MKNILKSTTLLYCASMLLATAAFTGCSDWNDVESKDIEIASLESKNGTLNQQYLDNLVRYKQTDHKVILGWFDNSEKMPYSRAQHLASLPDSMDIVSLMYGGELTQTELKEMAELRTKGTKVLYSIDYDATKKAIDKLIAENLENGVTGLTFNEYLAARMDEQLSYLDQYGYDGISLSFVGFASQVLSDAQLAEQTAIQNIVFGKLKTVMAAHSGKTFILEGRPMAIFDKTILESFKYFVLKTYECLGTDFVAVAVTDAMYPGVPTDRTIVSALPFSLDPGDPKTGAFYVNGVKYSAIVELAKWMWMPKAYPVAGIGVYKVNNDYYNIELDYKYTREAIGIMNPSPKN